MRLGYDVARSPREGDEPQLGEVRVREVQNTQPADVPCDEQETVGDRDVASRTGDGGCCDALRSCRVREVDRRHAGRAQGDVGEVAAQRDAADFTCGQRDPADLLRRVRRAHVEGDQLRVRERGLLCNAHQQAGEGRRRARERLGECQRGDGSRALIRRPIQRGVALQDGLCLGVTGQHDDGRVARRPGAREEAVGPGREGCGVRRSLSAGSEFGEQRWLHAHLDRDGVGLRSVANGILRDGGERTVFPRRVGDEPRHRVHRAVR